MPDPHVIAPTIAAGEKVKGPASYFPSIEKTYGRPIQEGCGSHADHATRRT